MKMGSEYILATPDAYAWVAGAAGSNSTTAGSPMVTFLHWTARVFRSTPANVAFWAPTFLASLVTIPLVLWSGLLRAPSSAILIATVGSLVPAFYARTRLGFFDTDWATLFFPLVIAFLLASWLRPQLGPWDRKKSRPNPSDNSILLPGATILLIQAGMPWHGFVRAFAMVSVGLSVALVLFLAHHARRDTLLWRLAALGVAVLWGSIGGLLGIALLLSSKRLEKIKIDPWFWRLRYALLLLVLLVGLALAETHAYVLDRFSRYFSQNTTVVAERNLGSEISYPPLSASVGELQSPTVSGALQAMAYFWWLGALGIAALGLLIRYEPVTVLIVPLVVLGLASIQLGYRFLMFGGSVVLMVAIVPIEWLIRARRQGIRSLESVIFVVSLGATLVGAQVISREYSALPARPVLTREHAEALLALREIAGGEGMVWTWWDYGYATQYYARLNTFADPGRNTGEYLVTLGKVLSAGDPLVARNLIMLSAMSDYRPWDVWERAGVDAFDRQSEQSSLWPLVRETMEAQYVAVQWEVLSALPWMTYYGTWDFEASEGQFAHVEYIVQPPRIDMNSGELLGWEVPALKVASLDVLGPGESQHYDFDQDRRGLHLLINQATDKAHLLDSNAYYSTIVQLLVQSPDELANSSPFTLVVRRDPYVRIFLLR